MFQASQLRETGYDTESQHNTARFGSQSDSETRLFTFGGHPASIVPSPYTNLDLRSQLLQPLLLQLQQ